jgi:hypothetical protein
VACAYFHRNRYSASEFYATDQWLYPPRRKLNRRWRCTYALSRSTCCAVLKMHSCTNKPPKEVTDSCFSLHTREPTPARSSPGKESIVISVAGDPPPADHTPSGQRGSRLRRCTPCPLATLRSWRLPDLLFLSGHSDDHDRLGTRRSSAAKKCSSRRAPHRAPRTKGWRKATPQKDWMLYRSRSLPAFQLRPLPAICCAQTLPSPVSR